MFEKASRLKLRFSVLKGLICVDDLWDLSLQDLNTIAKNLKKKIKESEEEDFLEEVSKEDEILQLRFKIVRHVLEIQKKELKARKELSLRKDEKQKILGIIAKKRDASLENLSEKELKKKLEELP